MKKIKTYTALTIGIIFLAVSCSSSGTENVVDTTQGVVTTEVSVNETTSTTEEREVVLDLGNVIEMVLADFRNKDLSLEDRESAYYIKLRPLIVADNVDSVIDRFKQENREEYLIESYNPETYPVSNRDYISRHLPGLERIKRELQPLPSHIDPRLRNHWIRYGEGPEGCNPDMPNYHQDACYQYQIGPGKSDPPNDAIYEIVWPHRGVFVPLRPGKTCPKWREDPTWVDEGMVPYFATRPISRERNVEALKYNEFTGYIAALTIANAEENVDIAGKDPSWENCLLLYSIVTSSSPENIEKRLSNVALDLEGGRYFIHFRENKSYSIFINTLGDRGEARGYFCSKRTKNNDIGSYSRDGKRLNNGYSEDSGFFDEEGYIVEYAQGYLVENYDGKTRGRAAYFPDSPSRSCEKDWEAIRAERGLTDIQTDGVKVINRWYEIPVAAVIEYTNSNIVELESAVACLVGTTRDEIFPNLEVERSRYLQLDFDSLTCDEVRATGKFNNILNLTPSTTERSLYSGGP